MKSNNILVGISILFLVLAASAFVVLWADVSSAVKIGMFAFGFGSGVSTGARIAKHRK